MQKFRLDNKTAFVVGGLGLIGRQVSTAFSIAGAKTIVLDLDTNKAHLFDKEMHERGYDLTCRFFDCADLKKIDKNFSDLLNENGYPDVFINCSYPRTEDWGDGSFKDITLESFRKNVDINMNSYAWLARLAACSMRHWSSWTGLAQLVARCR